MKTGMISLTMTTDTVNWLTLAKTYKLTQHQCIYNLRTFLVRLCTSIFVPIITHAVFSNPGAHVSVNDLAHMWRAEYAQLIP